MRKQFEYRHIVCFEDTNVMGNVYFANYISWQGRCRELFLKEKAAGISSEIENGSLALVTLHCSCSFLAELKAFDEVAVCMSLESIQHHRIKMFFEYYKLTGGARETAATGVHETGCFRRSSSGLVITPVPDALAQALAEYEINF